MTTRFEGGDGFRRLQVFSTSLLQEPDEERRRIARELHDGIGQYLVGAKLSLESYLAAAAGGDTDREALSAIIRTLDSCLTETRTISHLLHPPLLDELGFSAAAKLYVDGFSRRSGIQVNFTAPPGLPRMSSALELVLFRIVQESLTNIHRHSQSRSADILVQLDGNDVSLTVRDYGKGMPLELLEKLRSRAAAGGVGLNGMRERIIQFRCRFEIE